MLGLKGSEWEGIAGKSLIQRQGEQASRCGGQSPGLLTVALMLRLLLSLILLHGSCSWTTRGGAGLQPSFQTLCFGLSLCFQSEVPQGDAHNLLVILSNFLNVSSQKHELAPLSFSLAQSLINGLTQSAT